MYFLQYWENCRWKDPTDAKDMINMAEKLSEAQSLHPPLQHCTLSRLKEILAIVRDDSSKAFISDEEGDCSSCGECWREHLTERPTRTPVAFSSLQITALGLPPLLPTPENLLRPARSLPLVSFLLS